MNHRLNYMMRLYVLSAIVTMAMTKYHGLAVITKARRYISSAVKAVVKTRRAIYALLIAAVLSLGVAAPASAWQPNYIKDSVWDNWGRSCPPTVVYHGNGWETVYERRYQVARNPGPKIYELQCAKTGYVQTGYYTRLFPWYY